MKEEESGGSLLSKGPTTRASERHETIKHTVAASSNNSQRLLLCKGKSATQCVSFGLQICMQTNRHHRMKNLPFCVFCLLFAQDARMATQSRSLLLLLLGIVLQGLIATCTPCGQPSDCADMSASCLVAGCASNEVQSHRHLLWNPCSAIFPAPSCLAFS